MEFSSIQYEELRDFSNEEVGIPLTASAMDPKSIDFLVELGKGFWRNGRCTLMGRGLRLKYGFCIKSLRKNATLTS